MTSGWGKDTRRQRHHKHYHKRIFQTRRQAWRTIFRIWREERRIDSLMPYTCTWHNDRRLPDDAPVHIHIGHRPKHRHDRTKMRCRARRKLRWWWRSRIWWPYCRLRRRWRQLGAD